MDSYLHMIFHMFSRCFEQKRSPAKPECAQTQQDSYFGWKRRQYEVFTSTDVLDDDQSQTNKQTKKTPISNIKGSLFCTRMCGNPGRIKQTDIIREKCLFYRCTDGHRARKQRKKTGEQSYSEGFDRLEIPGQHKDAPLQTWWHPADWAPPPQSYSNNC